MNKQMKVFIVYSGKGGVGKTTTTANIARILAAKGKTVFILDADVNTPSIPVIFEKAEHSQRIHCASIGYQTRKSIYLTDSAIRAYISECINEINEFKPDYVLIDTPPSITDVHISLLDKIQPSGLLIVTQPNELSITDVNRTGMFFNDRNVPILGIVENMCLPGTQGKYNYTWKVLGSIPFSQDFNNKTVFNANKEAYNKIADAFAKSSSVIMENKNRALFDESLTEEDIMELPTVSRKDIKFVNLQTWEFIRNLLIESQSHMTGNDRLLHKNTFTPGQVLTVKGMGPPLDGKYTVDCVIGNSISIKREIELCELCGHPLELCNCELNPNATE